MNADDHSARRKENTYVWYHPSWDDNCPLLVTEDHQSHNFPEPQGGRKCGSILWLKTGEKDNCLTNSTNDYFSIFTANAMLNLMSKITQSMFEIVACRAYWDI